MIFDNHGNLYAGGSFTTADGVPCNRIAKWDGTAWSSLGTGMNITVNTLAFDNHGNLYAGGSFITADGVPCNRIAKWDGTTWSSLGTGMDDTVFTLAFDNDGNLYAGGFFTTANGVSCNCIAKIEISDSNDLYRINLYVNDKLIYPIIKYQIINVSVTNNNVPYSTLVIY